MKTAKQHEAPTRYLWQAGPGIGKTLRLVLRDEGPDSGRCPRGQDVASSARLGKGAPASAGQRWGTAGKHRGQAHRKWAFSAAATLVLRPNPAGPRLLARGEKQPGPGKARTILAHQLARAVSYIRTRQTAFEMGLCLRASGAERVSLAPHGTPQGDEPRSGTR